MRWISVKEFLPDSSEDVLVTIKDHNIRYVIIAHYSRGKWMQMCTLGGYEYNFYNPYEEKYHPTEYTEITEEVTAWMMLPEPSNG